MKNVLLLCISPVKKNARNSEYLFQSDDAENIYLNGLMTNEAPTKAIIQLLKRRGGGQRLDKVVAICSESVRNGKVKLTAEENDLETMELFRGKDLSQLSHYDVYRELINDYACKVDPTYVSAGITYEEVYISDTPEENTVSKAAIEAANLITGIGEQVELYIDYNGGPRSIAFMLLAIANLMKLRMVKIRQIMSMNFDNKVDNKVPIQNMEPVFESFDLIAGINEYVNYGRIKGLNEYFQASDNKEIKNLLREMEEFSNNLQLCRTDYVMKHKETLLGHLQSYQKREKDKAEEEKTDARGQLFLYVVEDILVGYKGLLDGEIPQVIKWCVDHDFIQQALTFCSEEMPGYFWRSGIFKASPLEKPEYNKFLELVHSKEGEKYSSLRSDYRIKHEEGSSKYAYEWMIYYLPFSANNKKNKDYKALLANVNESYKRQIFFGPDVKKYNNIKNGLGHFQEFNMTNIPLTDKQISAATSSAAALVWQFRQTNRRVKSKIPINRKAILEEIFVVYFLLKGQRNITNHAAAASGGDTSEVAASEEIAVWTYGQICKVLKQMTEVLRKI